ncbi:GNAT family N-acetyltransferase [Candidatus Binatia bacterium]|nr:GNAT family N-acetyltransferase [Candidatus Binatia bacterium]
MNGSASAPDAGPCVRAATAEDLPAIVALLRDDDLGATRERAAGSADALAPYRDAFAEIAADPRHEVLVLDVGGAVAGVLQLSFLRCLTHEGGRRAQIEGVRVDRARRGGGLGRILIEDAVRRARERGCHLVQLTTDRRRQDALVFYERLGFVASHHGMKLDLGR